MITGDYVIRIIDDEMYLYEIRHGVPSEPFQMFGLEYSEESHMTLVQIQPEPPAYSNGMVCLSRETLHPTGEPYEYSYQRSNMFRIFDNVGRCFKYYILKKEELPDFLSAHPEYIL